MPSKEEVSQEVYERILAGNRARQKTATGKVNHLKANNAYRLRHRQRTRARDVVAYAIRKGVLKKQPCERCGRRRDVEAHHENYRKPFAITWLCPRDHWLRHAEMRKEKRRT